MAQPPKEPTDFGPPDFEYQQLPEPEEPFGIGSAPSGESPSGQPPVEPPPPDSTGSVESALESGPLFDQMPEALSGLSVESSEEKSEEQQEESAEPTFWQRLGAQLDTYTVILLLSFLAISVAVLLLGLELSAYQWDIGAKAASGG